MSGQIVRALVAKDVTLFFRNRFFALISVLGLAAYGVMYFLMPATVDETLEIGLYATQVPPLLAAGLEGEGLAILEFDSEADLRAAVADGAPGVGIVLPAGTLETLAAGGRATAHVYLAAEVPADFQEAYTVLLEEVAFLVQGRPLNLEVTEEVLGTDMAGAQVPARDRMRPLFAVFVLMMETLGLASLLSAEITSGTLQALLVTPMTVGHLFAGKGLTGVGLAFFQAALLVAVTGGLGQRPLLVLVALLLGAVLVTGIGFLMASVGRDMMSVLPWGVLSILLLSIPSLAVLFPGTISGWMKVIPSHYLVDVVHRVANYGAGWGDVWLNLPILLAFDVAFVGLGILALRRKMT